MDKFGIFKLLSSFLNSYQTNSSGEKTNTANQNGNVLETLVKSFTSQTDKNTKGSLSEQKPQPVQEQKPYLPLQAGMLSTMRSHDEFIKRVREKVKR